MKNTCDNCNNFFLQTSVYIFPLNVKNVTKSYRYKFLIRGKSLKFPEFLFCCKVRQTKFNDLWLVRAVNYETYGQRNMRCSFVARAVLVENYDRK